MMKAILAALTAMGLCVGCTALDVDVEGSAGSCTGTGPCKTSDREGFPFNVKVPQRVQTTKIAVPVIVIEVKENAQGALLAAPIEMRGTQDLNKVIEGVNTTAGEANALADITTRLQALRTPAQPLSGVVVPIPEGARTVANTITVEAVLSDKQYYFSPRMPIAGSAAATVKPGSDGTLSEASVNVTDKTLEVLPNLIPFKEMLLARKMTDTKDKRGKRKSGPTVVVSLATEIHTLKKVLPPGTQEAKPLSLGDVDAGKAELVSIVKVGAEPASGPEKPAYAITGKITLPDPPK